MCLCSYGVTLVHKKSSCNARQTCSYSVCHAHQHALRTELLKLTLAQLEQLRHLIKLDPQATLIKTTVAQRRDACCQS